MSAFNWRFYRALNVDPLRFCGQCGRLTAQGRCNKPVAFLVQYDYVTGAAGRISTSDRWLCEEHGKDVAIRRQAEDRGEVLQDLYFGRREEAFKELLKKPIATLALALLLLIGCAHYPIPGIDNHEKHSTPDNDPAGELKL